MSQFKNTVLKTLSIFTIAVVVFYSCAPQQQPCDNVTDIDGNTYNVIKIGTQCWMAENLNVTRYRNGDPIINTTDSATWVNLSTGAYCDYNNDTANSSVYGRLYNWFAASDSRNIAPVGWHIPSDAEWATLENYLGGDIVAGGKMKVSISNIPPWNGSDTYGFSALPAGERNNGKFVELATGTGYCSITEWNASMVWGMYMNSFSNDSYRGYFLKTLGISIRCIKDE